MTTNKIMNKYNPNICKKIQEQGSKDIKELIEIVGTGLDTKFTNPPKYPKIILASDIGPELKGLYPNIIASLSAECNNCKQKIFKKK